MGNNKELNLAPPIFAWPFFTWYRHWKRLNHGGKDVHGLDRAHVNCYLEYNVEIKPTKNKFGTGISCALRFKTVWEIIQCCLTSKGYRGLEPANLSILYDTKNLRRGNFIRNLLYMSIEINFWLWVWAISLIKESSTTLIFLFTQKYLLYMSFDCGSLRA